MGRDGPPRRWRISFHRHRSAAVEPPSEFICPISKTLMFDPTIVSSGHTFERMSVKVCRDLGFTPTLSDGSMADFTTVIPNLALKASIQNWCSKTGFACPSPSIHSDIKSIVYSLMDSSSLKNLDSSANRVSSPDAATESNSRDFHLQLKTRPSCFSSSSSPSTSSEFISNEISSNDSSAPSSTSPKEDEEFACKIQSSDVFDQDEALICLRKTTKVDIESRATLCTEKLLLALKQALNSPYVGVQTNAAATVVNLSIEKSNKIKIVRAGVVPLIIDILRNGSDESSEHAAGAIFSLAIEYENKTTIGVLGALQPLVHAARSGSRRRRLDSVLALYHLTLVQSNRVKIVKLGALGALLGLLKEEELTAAVVLVVGNLASGEPGRAALMDAGAVGSLVEVLREGSEVGSESTRENIVSALYMLSFGSLRFKELARRAGASEVLEAAAERRSEAAREKVWRILERLRRREEAEPEPEEEVDWEAVMKGGVGRAGYRVGRSGGPSSSEF